MKQQRNDICNNNHKVYIYIYVKSPNKAKNNVLLNNMKKFVLKSVKIQKLLINIHITCRNIILT